MPGIGFIIDAHVLIWTVDEPNRLTLRANQAISTATNDLYLSAGTIWELAIKVGLNKLQLSLAFDDWMNRAIADLGLITLPITVRHAHAQSQLSQHHGDPFDRLLVAQAQVENLTIISADSIFDQYSVPRDW